MYRRGRPGSGHFPAAQGGERERGRGPAGRQEAAHCSRAAAGAGSSRPRADIKGESSARAAAGRPAAWAAGGSAARAPLTPASAPGRQPEKVGRAPPLRSSGPGSSPDQSRRRLTCKIKNKTLFNSKTGLDLPGNSPTRSLHPVPPLTFPCPTKNLNAVPRGQKVHSKTQGSMFYLLKETQCSLSDTPLCKRSWHDRGPKHPLLRRGTLSAGIFMDAETEAWSGGRLAQTHQSQKLGHADFLQIQGLFLPGLRHTTNLVVVVDCKIGQTMLLLMCIFSNQLYTYYSFEAHPLWRWPWVN